MGKGSPAVRAWVSVFCESLSPQVLLSFVLLSPLQREQEDYKGPESGISLPLDR